MSPTPALLATSLKQLTAITNMAYTSTTRPVAVAMWQKHLQPGNPQWKYINAKPFFIKNTTGSAHVMAMYDKRLPKLGLVGYFACTNAKAGAKVLNLAAKWLKDTYGLTNIYGPINGTLPSDYRLNTKDDFCFPGEPVNPVWHIDAFKQAGFSVFNRYVSGYSNWYLLFMKLTILKKPKRGYKHLQVRPFNTNHHDRDFKTYHDLRNLIFPTQSVYCPAISLQERAYHSPGKFDPSYTYFLLDNGREVGFIMAYTYKSKLVLKTIGVLPEYRGKQLRGLLIKPIRDQAKKDGLKVCIYAMVRVGNSIHKKRGFGAKVFRNYVTMHKSL